LPAFKLAGEWRVDADEFDHWRESQRFQPQRADTFEPLLPAARPQRGSLGAIVADRKVA
ncbi:MAG: hypothetical protein JHC87_09475, partial [Thermoleophilaceae bacterium]|nr:hypothetical protein [Thermoleophilaceae bacterium]